MEGFYEKKERGSNDDMRLESGRRVPPFHVCHLAPLSEGNVG